MSRTLPSHLQVLNAAAVDARRAFEQAVFAHYKLDVKVAWMHGGHRQTGSVLRCDAHARLWVRNDKTRNAVWVDASNLI